jgi:hypothetical protein
MLKVLDVNVELEHMNFNGVVVLNNESLKDYFKKRFKKDILITYGQYEIGLENVFVSDITVADLMKIINYTK